MGELIVANADGTGANVYGKAGEFPWASWSPDAKQLACLTKTGIEICDFATKKVLRKLERKGIYEQLFWSPDGQWLTGTANHYGESWTVVRMNATTGEVNGRNADRVGSGFQDVIMSEAGSTCVRFTRVVTARAARKGRAVHAAIYPCV